jgi:hypothetical protein
VSQLNNDDSRSSSLAPIAGHTIPPASVVTIGTPSLTTSEQGDLEVSSDLPIIIGTPSASGRDDAGTVPVRRISSSSPDRMKEIVKDPDGLEGYHDYGDEDADEGIGLLQEDSILIGAVEGEGAVPSAHPVDTNSTGVGLLGSDSLAGIPRGDEAVLTTPDMEQERYENPIMIHSVAMDSAVLESPKISHLLGWSAVGVGVPRAEDAREVWNEEDRAWYDPLTVSMVVEMKFE